MGYILNQLLNGICQGSIYALMAIGYSVIVGVVGMVTFTYGEVMMIGAFSAYYIFQGVGNNLPLAILAAFVGSFVIGIVIYKLCYERFFNAPRHISLLCTIGISMLLKNLAQIVFGPETKPVLNIIDNKTFNINLFGAVLNIKLLQIVIIILVIVLAVALTLFFNKTKWGVMLRAVSQNKDASYLMGINVKRTALLGNCIGCGFGGIAGILLSIYYYSVSATMGSSYSMKAFAASVLGGLVDIRFSALGGLCIGIIENLGIVASAAVFRDVFAFAFLILVLLFRPQGFLSKKGARV
jgi:branched-chain amino acid transport system permease protein